MEHSISLSVVLIIESPLVRFTCVVHSTSNELEKSVHFFFLRVPVCYDFLHNQIWWNVETVLFVSVISFESIPFLPSHRERHPIVLGTPSIELTRASGTQSLVVGTHTSGSALFTLFCVWPGTRLLSWVSPVLLGHSRETQFPVISRSPGLNSFFFSMHIKRRK